MTTQFVAPPWAFEFHGHQCPFMPIGYRMGRLALERLGLEREKDHGLFVIAELGEGHPQTCLMDGIQVATGATFGKLLISKTFYGKLAATFYHREKGGIRFSLRPDAVDEMGKFKFIAVRKTGVEPSQIPAALSEEIIRWVYEQTDESLFAVELKPDYQFKPVKGSFSKTKCATCGEYVFDRYLRMKEGKPVCIPCSGY